MAGTNLYTAISDTCWVALTREGGGTQLGMLAKCTGTPPTTADVFEHGCIMVQTDSTTGQNAIFQNTGSSAVPVWRSLESSSTGGTIYGLVTQSTNGTTPVTVFGGTAPFSFTVTGVYAVSQSVGVATLDLVRGAGGTIATVVKVNSAGAMSGAATLAANAAVAVGDTLNVVSSGTENGQLFVAFRKTS